MIAAPRLRTELQSLSSVSPSQVGAYITVGVGTRGLGQDCAPSYSLTQGTDYEASTITAALNKGYAVAVTDYQGMGLPGPHTYMVGKALGHAVLDMARAAERLPGSGLSSSTPVGILGYSEGGAAAGWAAELAPSYAPDLNLKGVAMGGVPADLLQVASMLDGSAFLSFELMTAVGYNKAYPELNLNSYLNAAGKDLLATAIDTCLVSVDGFGQIAGTAYKHVSDFTTSDPLATSIWKARITSSLSTRVCAAAEGCPPVISMGCVAMPNCSRASCP